MTYTNRTVSVENSSGASQAYITGKTVRSGTMGGIAVSSEGKAVEVVSLKKADVSRADFDGEEAVVVEGLRVPVSDGVEVYNQETGRWTTLSADQILRSGADRVLQRRTGRGRRGAGGDRGIAKQDTIDNREQKAGPA